MRRAWTLWLAWGLWIVFVVLTIATIWIDETTAAAPNEADESLVADLGLVVAFGAFATVGALVASRLPRNAVGWLFIACPLFAIIGAFSGEYAYHAYVNDPGSLPAASLFGWLYLWTWYPAIGIIGLVVLLFPDGRPAGRRWRPLLWLYTVLLTLGTLGAWVYPGPIDDSWSFPSGSSAPDNPLGIAGLQGVLDTASALGAAPFFAMILAVFASVVVRFRRSRGDERQQLKWMLVAVAILTIHIVLEEAFSLFPDDAVNVLFGLAVASIPIAAGVAMVKYRLYDVDVVIRKGLVYIPLTVLLGGAYAAVVVGMQAVLRPLTGGSDLAIAVSTLVVAALFLPVRARVQRFVDRRFYRRRYDAQRTLEAFGARLREQIEVGALVDDVREVVVETMQPAHISVWRRGSAS